LLIQGKYIGVTIKKLIFSKATEFFEFKIKTWEIKER